MNAWSGLRSMPGLSTAAMVVGSVLALIVTSNITAGASPDLALSLSSQQNTRPTTSHPSQTFTFLGATSSPGLHVKKKTHQQQTQVAGQQDKSKQAAAQQEGSAAPADNSSTGANQQSGTGVQPEVATLSALVVQQECAQGQMTYGVKSAQLNFQSPTTAKSTVTWRWETRIDSGTNTSGALPADSSPDSQVIPANASTATLTASSGASQIFSATASQNYAYSFRLDVMMNGVEALSDWYSVPQQAAGACQQPNASSPTTVK